MTTNDNCLTKYAPKNAQRIARAIVERAMRASYTVSVNDGEEWTVLRSSDRRQIKDAMATTDFDRLLFRDAEGKAVGSVILIYCNDSDCISDHTDNEAMSALVANLY